MERAARCRLSVMSMLQVAADRFRDYDQAREARAMDLVQLIRFECALLLGAADGLEASYAAVARQRQVQS